MSSARSSALGAGRDVQAETAVDQSGPRTAGRERRTGPLHPSASLTDGVTLLDIPWRSSPDRDDPDGQPLDAQTRRLVADIAQTLGLTVKHLNLRIDEHAARETARHGAHGLVKDATVLLHPTHFDPHSRRGRYLLGHELTHVAQLCRFRTHRGQLADPGLSDHEVEAYRIGTLIAEGRLPHRPVYELPDDAVAASVELDDLVAERYEQEVERIRRLLRGFLGFLWVTDGDISQVLTILQSFSFVTACSVVNALDRGESSNRYKRRLMGEISSGHFERFRLEILAAYSVMPRDILSRADEAIFDGMDFRGLSDEEHFAVRQVRDHGFPEAAWQTLMDPGQQGEARAEAVRQTIDDPAQGALGPSRFDLAEQERAAQTQLASEAVTRARAVERVNDVLGDILREITTALEDDPSDAQRLQVIDQMHRYIEQPQLFRGIVESLQPPTAEEDLLDRLLRHFPARALYRPALPDVSREEREGARVPGPHTRLSTLLRIAALRPPYRNVELAEDLLSEAWIFNEVNEEEAYLAFQLIKALPERIRENFLEAEGGVFADRMRENLTQEMRESATMNFYTGGEGRLDLASIQSQLLEDAVWQPEQTGRLEALIRMAIAAGEHHWVFNQSRLRHGTEGSEQRRQYTHDDFLQQIVEPFQLYHPAATDADGNAAPRRRWRPEYLRAVERGGVFDFIFQSREPWSMIGSALFGQSLGGEGLNAVALQDVLGGSFLGIRFAAPEEMQDDELAAGARRAMEDRRGTNFIDSAHWDTDRGVLEVRADDLVIAAVRYPVGSLLMQADGGRLRGLNLNLVYPTREVTDQAPAMHLLIRQLDLDDMLLIFHDSMVGINELRLSDLQVDLGRDAVRGRRGAADRGFDARTLFPLTPLLRLIGLASGELGDRGGEISEALTNPPVASPLSMTVGSLTLGGLTTSSGHYVDSVELGALQVGISGTREDYLYFLRQSRGRLARRRTRLERRLAAVTDESQRTELEERLARVNRSHEGVSELIDNITAAEREVRELNSLSDPSPQQRQRLASQQDFLRGFDRGGMVLDAGRIRLRGFAGREQGEGINLADVHGRGTSTAGLLAFLTESDSIHRILQGDDYRAPVVRSLQRDEGSFVLDLCDVALPEDFTLYSGIPSEEDADREYQRAYARLGGRAWDHALRDEVQRLFNRRRDAARYHQLARIGITYLNADDQQEMRQLRESLTSEEAFYAHRVTAEGARLEFGQSGRRIGLYAERFDALRPVDDDGHPVQGGVALRLGGIGVGEAHGRDIHAAVEIQGGILNPSEGGLISSEDIRRRLSRITLRGAHLAMIDFEQAAGQELFEGGILREFGLEIDPRSGIVDVHAHDATTVSQTLLQREIDRLQGIPEERRSAAENEQITTLHQALESLQGFEAEIEQLQREIREASDDEQRAPLQESLTALLIAFRAWRRDLPISSGSVSDVSVRITGLENLASPDFHLEDALERGVTLEGTGPRDAPTLEPTGERQTGRLFSSATLTNPRFAGSEGRRVEAGAAYGRLEYSHSRIGFHDIYIEQLSLEGVASQVGAHRFWSHGISTLSGILATGEILYEQNGGNPRQRDMTAINLNHLSINNIAGQRLGYANRERNLEAEIESGSIGDIVLSYIEVDMRGTSGEGTSFQGTVRLGSFSNAVLSARVGDALRRVRGRLNGRAVTIGFLASGERQINIEDLNIDQGLIRTDAGTIRLSAQHLRGEIVQSADGNIYRFNDIRLQQLNFGRIAYRAGEQLIRSEGPTELRNVQVTAQLNMVDPRNWQLQLNHIHADSITSQHLVYERAGYVITIRRPQAAATEGEATAPEATRPPLEIVNLDIRNIHWSTRGGLQGGGRGPRPTIGADTLHAALNIHRDEFMDLNAVVDTGRISVEFNDEGERVVDIDTLGIEASGQLRPGVQVDVSAQRIDPGVITIGADNAVEIPHLSLPLIEINSLDLNRDTYRLQIFDQGESVRLRNTLANLRVELDFGNDEQPVRRILVRSLRIPTTEANNARLTLKNLQEADQETGQEARDLILRIEEDASATITDIRLGGRGESAEGFEIRPTATGWSTEGLLTFGRADVQTLGFELQNYLNGTTNAVATGREEGQPAFTMGFFSDGRFNFNLQQLNLTELEATRGEHHIEFSSAAAASGETAGITLQNLRRTEDGNYALDELSARGIVYENSPLGLTVRIQQATLPQGLDFSRGGLLEVPELSIQQAGIEIDDLQAMLRVLNSRPPSGLRLNLLPVLDAVQGTVTLRVIVGENETPATIPIRDGRIRLAEIERSLSTGFQWSIAIEAVDDRLVFTIDPPNASGPDTITTITYAGLDEERRPTGEELETPVATFLESSPDIATTNPPENDDSAPPLLRDINARLRISPAPLIEVNGGQLRLRGQENRDSMDIVVTGQVGGPDDELHIDIPRASLEAVEGQPITINGVTLRDGNLTVTDIDADVAFSGFDYGHVQGTIGNATLSGAQLQFSRRERSE